MTIVQVILGFLILGGGHNDRLLFQTNQGQAPADVRYLLDIPQYLLQFKRGEMVFQLRNNATIQIQFAGPLVKRVPAGNGRLDGVVRYINADGTLRKPNVPTFSSVRYEALYSGIDLSCHGRGGQLECDFVTMPGADPGQIQLTVDGADGIGIDNAGNLNMEVSGQTVQIHKPSALQVEHSQRNPIDVRYQLSGTNQIGLAVGPYNHSVPLIIDFQ